MAFVGRKSSPQRAEGCLEQVVAGYGGAPNFRYVNSGRARRRAGSADRIDSEGVNGVRLEIGEPMALCLGI